MKFQKFYLNKILVGGCIAFFTSCALAPVGSHFESASTINKNSIEVSGNYENYYLLEEGVTSRNYNFGGTVGYGISDKFDVKVRYSRLNGYKEDFGDNPPTSNFVSITPKYMIVEDVLSVKLPVSAYIPDGGEESVAAIAPAVLASLPVNDNFDITFGTQYQVPFEEGYDSYLGLSLGLGLSTNKDVWSFRPEMGFQSNLMSDANSFFNYGFALLYNFNLNKN